MFSNRLICSHPEPEDIQSVQPGNEWLKEKYQLERELQQSRESVSQANQVIDELTRRLENLDGNSQPKEVSKLPRIASDPPLIPVIVFTYNRAQYLERTLKKLFEYLPSEKYPLIVSQDGTNEEVAKVVASFPRLIHIQRKNRVIPPKASASEPDVYYHISQHYKFALSYVFDTLQYEQAIILEDDMEISPDFFSYFIETLPILRNDDTLYCVSAWNDNGQEGHVKDPYKLYRSDFFPGLGWMITRNLWKELSSKWPGGFWDDWLREPPQRQDRDCIHPEISRTYTFGKLGSSAGQFYDKYLSRIVLNQQQIRWPQQDLSYLSKSNYDKLLLNEITSATTLMSVSDISKYQNSSLLLYYSSESHFNQYAERFGIMPDFKAGVPRTGYTVKPYEGVVIFYFGGNKIFLAKKAN